ncbi:MAG: DEAD/DEAH box helicase family protein [Oscillospiraceae bacterium]|nr:DEAD/DEAH box helicase family protein [Oscillospiraceae bacterium]
MDKTLADYLYTDIENDQFLCKQFEILLLDYSKSIVCGKSASYTNEYRSLLRYADMLSLSNEEKHHNIAEQIVILLSHLFPTEDEVLFFKQNIYNNVSNFASANILENRNASSEQLDFFRQLEIESHKIGNIVPGTDKHFFDTQRIALENLEKNQYYSFSAPTSMGKTFILTNYIRKKIAEGSQDNFVIIVPTRALLSEIANGIIKDFSTLLGEGCHKVVTTMASVQSEEKCIAILTPERFYYSLLKRPDYSFKYVFIDEAHKISDTDKRSIIYYKILDMLKSHEDINIYFSSPVIPNPDIYLELTNYYSQPESSAK